MSWGLKIGLAFAGSFLAILAAALMLRLLWGFSLGFAAGVAMCAFFPILDTWVRSCWQNAKTLTRRFVPHGTKLGVTGLNDRNRRNSPIDAAAPSVAKAAFVSRKAAYDAFTVAENPSPPLFWDRFSTRVTAFARAGGNIIAFLWRWRGPIAALLVLVVIAGVMRSCASPFDLGKSRGEIRLERDLALEQSRITAIVAERDAAIAAAAQAVAVRRAEIVYIARQGREEIASAQPLIESPIDAKLVTAWRGAVERLCIYPTDATSAVACGASARS